MTTYKVSVSSMIDNHLAFHTYYIESATEQSASDTAIKQFATDNHCSGVIAATATVWQSYQ